MHVGCPHVRVPHVGASTQVFCAQVVPQQVFRQVGTPVHVAPLQVAMQVAPPAHVPPTQVLPTQVLRPPHVAPRQVGWSRHVFHAPQVLVQQLGPLQVTMLPQVTP